MAVIDHRGWIILFLAVSAFLAPGCGDAQDQAAAGPAAAGPAAAGPLERIELTVQGMTCQNCVNTIERVLSRCAGVEDVGVDLEKGAATVAGRGLNADALIGAVEDAGYGAAVARESSGEDGS